jgi:hypothetical protein
MKKSTKSKVDKITQDESDFLRKRFRYVNFENLAKDFTSKQERAAIEAVFKWLSFSGVVAWRLKSPSHYSTLARGKSLRRGINTWDAIIVDRELFDKAEALLSPKIGRKSNV